MSSSRYVLARQEIMKDGIPFTSHGYFYMDKKYCDTFVNALVTYWFIVTRNIMLVTYISYIKVKNS